MIDKELVTEQMAETIANIMGISYFDTLPLVRDEDVNIVIEHMTETFTSDCYKIVEAIKAAREIE